MVERENSRSLTKRIYEAALNRVEQHAQNKEDFEYGKDVVSHVIEVMRPALDALEREDFLDCVRHLDAVCMYITNLGFGDLVNLTAKRASENARSTERASLVRGWGHRARGYVDLVEGNPGGARRRFRQALRCGVESQDSTLIGASQLSIGVSFTQQDDERQARKAYEAALPYARQSNEPWVLAFVADNLAALMGPDESLKAERLYEESFRAREESPHGISPAPALTNLGILRSRQGRHSEAERLFEEALGHDVGNDPRDVLLPLQNLAKALADQRRFAEAGERYEEAIHFAREVGDVYREGQLRLSFAVSLANAGDYERSHEQFALLVKRAGPYGFSAAQAASIIRDAGATLMLLGRREEGIAAFREARRRYEVLRDKVGIAGSLLDEGQAVSDEDPEARVRLIREALITLKRTRHHDLKLKSYRRLIDALFEQRHINEARGVFAEERRLLGRLGRTRTLARRWAETGSMLANVRLHKEASRQFKRSADLYDELGDETEFMRARNDMANRLVQLGEIEEAEEVYLDNLERAQRHRNRALQMNALLNIGELHRRASRTDEALRTFQEANKLSRALHDLSALSLGLNNLGLALESSGDNEQALASFEQSVEAAVDAHDEAAVARALSSIGSNALIQERYRRALEMYQRAVDHAAEAGDKGLQAEMLLNLAAAVHKVQGVEEAEQIVERSVNTAQEVLHYDTAFDASSLMVDWFLEGGDMESAGEWSAYALLFGPLLSGEVDRWASWIVATLSDVPEMEERNAFVESMAAAARRLEAENNLDGQLTRGVEAVRSGLT